MSTNKLREHDIGLGTVVLIMYALVAAGCFGLEEIIAESGPGLTILMLAVLPILWAAPQALVSAELGSAIPEAGGFYKWVQRGLGEFWAFQAGWCRTLSCYVDNTLYVVLAASYMGQLFPMTEVQSFLFKFAIIVFFVYINLRGITDVGRVNTVLSGTVILAFIFVAIVGFTHWQYNPVKPFMPEGYTLVQGIAGGLATGMWIYSGYTSMSTLSGEIKDKTLIPKGLMIIMPLAALSYILPTIAGLSSVGSWDQWATSGGITYANVAGLAGAAFVPILLIVAVMSNLSVFNAYIISISRCFFSMAEDHLAPKVLAKLSKKYAVPYVGVISQGVVCMILCNFDFSILVTVDVLLLMVDYALVWISSVRLRQKEPNLERPFKIPVGTKGLACIVAPGLLICLLALFLNGSDYFLGGMIALISSPVMYVIFKRIYGGMSVEDPIKYKLNPKTKLGIGDMHRVATVFGFMGLLGAIGVLIIFPAYEGSWGAEYYADIYGSSGSWGYILLGIKVITVIYLLVAAVSKYIAVKVEPKGTKIW